jgi:hypothetical protein
MIKFENNNSIVADNSIVLNGVREYKLTDDETMKLMSIIDGMISQRSTTGVSTPSTQLSRSDGKVGGITRASKTPYEAKKAFKPQYEVKKLADADGKSLFCISRKNGWTRAEKALTNAAIKALPEIITISVPYEKDGKTRTFSAWGYKTKKRAEEMLEQLPTEFSADELNNWGK